MNALAPRLDPANDELHGKSRGLGLMALRAEIESAFLAIGEKLGRSAGILDRLSSMFDVVSGDLESPAHDAAGKKIEALGIEAQRLAAAFAAERRQMAALLVALRAATTPIDDLQRSVRTIGIVAVNARVVAAGLAGVLGGMEVFTADIATLSAQASSVVAKLAAAHAGLIDEVRRAEAVRANEEKTQALTLPALGIRLTSSLTGVTERRREAARLSTRSGDALRRLTARAAQAASVLQAGEDACCRLDHVDAALAMMIGEPGAPSLRAQRTEVTCSLQAAHLDDAADTLSEKAEASAKAMRSLAANVRDVASQALRSTAAPTQYFQEALAALETECTGVHRTLRECEMRLREFRSVGDSVSAAIAALLDQLGELSKAEAEMQLHSLNATVRCAQLGPQGRALAVIAEQFRSLIAETSACVSAAVSSLTVAADSASALRTDALQAESVRASALYEGSPFAMGRLVGAQRRLTATISILPEAASSVATLLREAAELLAGQFRTADAMKKMRSRLADLRLSASQGAVDTMSADDRQQIKAFMSRLRELYATDRERLLHDRTVAAVTSSPAASNSRTDARR